MSANNILRAHVQPHSRNDNKKHKQSAAAEIVLALGARTESFMCADLGIYSLTKC